MALQMVLAPRSQSQDTGSPPIQILAAAVHISVRVCIACASVCTCVQGDKGTGTPPLYRSQVEGAQCLDTVKLEE